jgi:hypothetical protein
LTYDFWLDQAAKGVRVSFRAQGLNARNATVSLDDRRLASVKLETGSSKVYELGPVEGELGPGRHVLSWRFGGGANTARSPLALLDWVRVYLPDTEDDAFLPAVRQNIVQDVTLSAIPRRSLALRAPGSVRCALPVVAGARVLVDVGFWGIGEGTVQVRVVTQDNRKVVLAERRVVGSEQGDWDSLDLSLDAFAGQLVGLEFAALEGGDSGRLVFGEPRIEKKRAPMEVWSAQNVVLIVAGGLSRRLIPPWGERQGKVNVHELSARGVVFEGYRASSTLVSSVMASLLTGVAPGVHQVLDPSARLTDAVPTLAELLRKSGGRAAMFTNVPFSFRAFGFARGFSEFVQTSPVEDRPASEPFTLAKKWLDKEIAEAPEQRRLVVVHTSAGHPPWDVTSDELTSLAPKDYAGALEPRRGAVVLREIRERSEAARRRLGPLDLQRLQALQEVALNKQDLAIGALLRGLEEAQQLERSLVIFMGDVDMGDPPELPFAPVGRLETGRLMAPLIVRFPGMRQAGERSSEAMYSNST